MGPMSSQRRAPLTRGAMASRPRQDHDDQQRRSQRRAAATPEAAGGDSRSAPSTTSADQPDRAADQSAAARSGSRRRPSLCAITALALYTRDEPEREQRDRDQQQRRRFPAYAEARASRTVACIAPSWLRSALAIGRLRSARRPARGTRHRAARSCGTCRSSSTRVTAAPHHLAAPAAAARCDDFLERAVHAFDVRPARCRSCSIDARPPRRRRSHASRVARSMASSVCTARPCAGRRAAGRSGWVMLSQRDYRRRDVRRLRIVDPEHAVTARARTSRRCGKPAETDAAHRAIASQRNRLPRPRQSIAASAFAWLCAPEQRQLAALQQLASRCRPARSTAAALDSRSRRLRSCVRSPDVTEVEATPLRLARQLQPSRHHRRSVPRRCVEFAFSKEPRLVRVVRLRRSW